MTDTTTQSAREKIIAKVRALLGKTIANGCTEEEAMSASALAAKLMQQYDLAHVDIEAEVKAERYGARYCTPGGPDRVKPHEVTQCANAVGQFWDCRSWGKNGTGKVVYFGSATDTEMAKAMLDMLYTAMEHEFRRYINGAGRSSPHHGRTLRTSFMAGMARRITERLREMKAERSAADQTAHGSRALVVVKGAVVTQQFAAYCRQTGLRLGTRSRSSTVGSGDAYRAGQAAANRVDLGGGKLAGAGPKRIA